MASAKEALPVLVEESRALPLVSVLCAFRSGSTNDPIGLDGLSRIVARMLRRGAKGITAEAFEETVDVLGGEFAADVSPSAMSVHFEVIRRSLDSITDLVATVLAQPLFYPEELARLVREAEAELVEARDSDRSLCSRAFRQTLFKDHPYARRVAGTIGGLRAITRDQVVEFYRRHYVRRNAVIAISGDVDADEGGRLAEELLAGLPEGEAVPDLVPPPPRHVGRRLVFVDKADRTQTQMVIGGLGTDPRDADHTALLVANTVFGGTFTSRLMQEIRAKRGWSYGASSRVGFDRQRDAFTIWTAPAATDAAACLALELELLHTLRDQGITASELEFVKGYLVRSHAFETDTAQKRVHRRLEAALFDLPAGYHEQFLDRVQAVTVDQANGAIRARLSEDDLVIGVVGTHSELGDALERAVPRLAAVTVLPFDFE